MASSLIGFNHVSDRIIIARFQSNPIQTSVIQAYAPTAEAEKIVHDELYERI